MKASLVNGDLEEVQSYKIEKTQGSPIPISNLNLFYLDQKLYIINQLAIFDRTKVKNESLITVFEPCESHKNNNSFSFLSFHENYEDPYSPELGLYYPAVDFARKNIYLSFSVSHPIQKYATLNHSNFSEFDLRPSDEFKIENSKSKSISQFVDRQLYYLENHNYGNLLVDPFQDLILRMAYYPVEDAKSMMGNNREIFKKRKVIIADLETHQIILEASIDEDLYYEGLMVATPLGILINKYSEDEDEILFEIFKVEKTN